VASKKSMKIWEELGLYAKSDGTVGMRNPPKLRDDEEEVKWLERTHEAVLDFAQEHKLGRKGPSPMMKRAAAAAASKERDTLISIRLAPGDLERARRQAEHKGLRYQSYIKSLLHQALEDEERGAA